MKQKFFKVLNRSGLHFNYQYHEFGLHISNKPIEIDGLHFADADNIHEFYSYGCQIVEITLPTDDPDFKMIEYAEKSKYRANMIILGKRWNMNDPQTYIKLKIKMMTMNEASEHGYIDILDWWLKSRSKIEYNENAIDLASRNGHIHILDWWIASGLKLLYTNYAIDSASKNNNIEILDWWISTKLRLKYTCDAIDWTAENGHIGVLEWWLTSGLKLLYSSNLVERLKDIGKKDMANWILNRGVEMKRLSAS